MNIAAADERAVDGHLARVVRDEEDAPGGHVLRRRAPRCGSTSGGAWPIARMHVLRPLGIEAERVDAGGAEGQGDAPDALGEGLAEQPLERRRRPRRRRGPGAAPGAPAPPRAARSMRASACERRRAMRVDFGARLAIGEVRPGRHCGRRARRRSTALCSARAHRCRPRSRCPPPLAPGRRAWSSSRRRARFRATSSGAVWPGCARATAFAIAPGVLRARRVPRGRRRAARDGARARARRPRGEGHRRGARRLRRDSRRSTSCRGTSSCDGPSGSSGSAT